MMEANVFTPQQKALQDVQQLYGKSAFTEDHPHFRMVGYREGKKLVVGVAETWDEAKALLARRMA